MQLVEMHVIGKKDVRYAAIDAACFASKNLYNAALYEIRQSFIHHGMSLKYGKMDKRMQNHEAYQGLPAKVAQQVLRLLERVGIRVILTEESYTSKASFLDRDPLPKYKKGDTTEHQFSGKRIKRGLYRARDGRLINADINGSGNIVRKVAPNAFGPDGVEDGKSRVHLPVVHPVRIVIPRMNPKMKVRSGLVSGFARV